MGTLTKNKIAYDIADVKVSMLGIDDIYAESIEYEIKREHQANYGTGTREPRSYSMGKDEYSSTIEINMIDVVAIQNAHKGKRMIDIEPFPIVCQYNPSVEGSLSPMVTDIIIAKFTNSGRSVSDMNSKKSFELFVLHISENE